MGSVLVLDSAGDNRLPRDMVAREKTTRREQRHVSQAIFVGHTRWILLGRCDQRHSWIWWQGAVQKLNLALWFWPQPDRSRKVASAFVGLLCGSCSASSSHSPHQRLSLPSSRCFKFQFLKTWTIFEVSFFDVILSYHYDSICPAQNASAVIYSPAIPLLRGLNANVCPILDCDVIVAHVR